MNWTKNGTIHQLINDNEVYAFVDELPNLEDNGVRYSVGVLQSDGGWVTSFYYGSIASAKDWCHTESKRIFAAPKSIDGLYQPTFVEIA